MKTFLEKVTTVPFPRARIWEAALSSSGRGVCSASSRAEARSRPSRARPSKSPSSGFNEGDGAAAWSRVFIDQSFAKSSKNLTQRSQRTHREHGEEEISGNGEDRCGERFSVAVAGAAKIEEYGHTRRANGHIGQTQTPGPAEGVTDDDGDAFAGALTKRNSEFFCGAVRMAWEQSYKIVARDIGMVDAGIGADETMMGFRYEHVIAADDAPRLIQDHLDGTGIFLQPRGEGTGLRGWSYRR